MKANVRAAMCRVEGDPRLLSGPPQGVRALGICLGLVLLAVSVSCTAGSPEAEATVPSASAAVTATYPTSPLPTATAPAPSQPAVAHPASPLATPTAPPRDLLPVYTYRVVRTYPHDPAAFTEGLVMHDGVLYEGTGLVGRSFLRRVDLESGTVRQSRRLPEPYFGEGIAVLGDQIVQLTWKSRVGFVYDRETFEKERTFTYATEGWGLTTDGHLLIRSDGTATLHFLDPETLREVSRVRVVGDLGPVVRLNELEYVNGEVWANVWKTDQIARIDPATGRLRGVIDLAGLLDRAALSSHVDVLNGIAYDAVSGRIFVTGKLWPLLFEIEVVPSEAE